MKKDEEKKNPFANPDGSPIDGKEPEFYEWEIVKDKERLSNLTEQEKKEDIESQKALQKRMES